MPIPVVCPGCQRRIEAHESWAGKAVPCPHCKQMAPVPAVAISSVVKPNPIVIGAPVPIRGERALMPSSARRQRSPRKKVSPWPPLAIALGLCGLLVGGIALLTGGADDRQAAATAQHEPPRRSPEPQAPRPAALPAPAEEEPKRPSTPDASPPAAPPPVTMPIPAASKAPTAARPPVPAKPPPRRAPPGPPRPYDRGPLGFNDFAAAPPAERQNLTAFTYSSIRYSYIYRKEKTAGGVQVFPTTATVYAEVDPNQSWNIELEDQRLLAHEQLHFDITQLYAMRWRNALETFIARGTLVGKGATEAAAQTALEAAVAREFRAVSDAMLQEQARYDDETEHGRDYERQDAWQMRVAEELKRVR